MEHLAQLLQEHFRNHPGMELRDAIKFLYQSSMGGGHLIADPAGLWPVWRRSGPDRGAPALSPQNPWEAACAAFPWPPVRDWARPSTVSLCFSGERRNFPDSRSGWTGAWSFCTASPSPPKEIEAAIRQYRAAGLPWWDTVRPTVKPSPPPIG